MCMRVHEKKKGRTTQHTAVRQELLRCQSRGTDPSENDYGFVSCRLLWPVGTPVRGTRRRYCYVLVLLFEVACCSLFWNSQQHALIHVREASTAGHTHWSLNSEMGKY